MLERSSGQPHFYCKKKVLFVTHDMSHYGASRSLELILKNSNGDFSLAVLKPFGTATASVQQLSLRYRIPEEKIYFFHLPQITSWIGFAGGIRTRLAAWFRRLIWRWNRHRFQRWALKQGFDVIHLNSLILSPMIHPNLPFVLHVRERFQGKLSSVRENIEAASGIIFIDHVTKQHLEGIKPNNAVVLPNPVDMVSCLHGHSRATAEQKVKFPLGGKTVFSYVGRIDFEDKGVDFLIKTFSKLIDDQIVFLIFGSGGTKLDEYICQLSSGDPRIHFCGPTADQGIIFSATDVILRGEDRFSMGRTVLEGVAAGCKVLLPGREADIRNSPELQNEIGLISCYEPRSEASLISALRVASRFRRQSKHCKPSSVDAYLKRFYGFIETLP